MPGEPLLLEIAALAVVIAGFTAVTAVLVPPGGAWHPAMRIRQRAVVSTSFNVMFEALAPSIVFAWLGDERAALTVASAGVALYATGIVIWRGRHVSDPTELSADDARDYFDEVLRVGRAIEQKYKPIKMNFEMLGNSLPHLHTHVVPRYLDDGEPGQPPHFMRIAQPDEAKIPDDQYAADLAALRALLDN